jgi:hypothetical protein
MAKTITQLPDATVVNGSDELIIQQSGVTKRATKTEVLNGIINANVDAAAAIAFSKLAALDSANILVGNGSNVATKVAVTGDVTISNAGVTTLARPYTLATEQASTSGTSIDFTGIPSWVKRITVMFNAVSTNGSSNYLIRIGAGSYESSGYSSTIWTTSTSTQSTAGFIVFSPVGAANNAVGIVHLSLLGSNVWVESGALAFGNTNSTGWTSAGQHSGLSGSLDRVRLTTVSGDTFDAGTINISYEG